MTIFSEGIIHLWADQHIAFWQWHHLVPRAGRGARIKR